MPIRHVSKAGIVAPLIADHPKAGIVAPLIADHPKAASDDPKVAAAEAAERVEADQIVAGVEVDRG